MGLDIPCREKMALLALADFSNDEGASFPSIAKLAKKAGMCARTAQMGLRRLEALELISTHKQVRSYGQTSNYFILAIDSVGKANKIIKFRPSIALLPAPPAYSAPPPAYSADITSNNNLTQDILEPYQEKNYLY